MEFAFFLVSPSPPPSSSSPSLVSPLASLPREEFYRARYPRCRLRFILQLSLIQRIPWSVIITPGHFRLLLFSTRFSFVRLVHLCCGTLVASDRGKDGNWPGSLCPKSCLRLGFRALPHFQSTEWMESLIINIEQARMGDVLLFYHFRLESSLLQRIIGKSVSPKFATFFHRARLERRKKGRKKKKSKKNGLLEVGNNCRISKQKRFEYVRTVLRNIPRGA